MGKAGIKKNTKIDVVFDKGIQDMGRDPSIEEKAKKASAFLKKHGTPESFDKKNQKRP